LILGSRLLVLVGCTLVTQQRSKT